MLVQIFSSNIDKISDILIASDAFVLIQNGIYCSHELVKITNKPIYAIQDDVSASGLFLPNGIALISNETWVDLCIEHSPIVSFQ